MALIPVAAVYDFWSTRSIKRRRFGARASNSGGIGIVCKVNLRAKTNLQRDMVLVPRKRRYQEERSG